MKNKTIDAEAAFALMYALFREKPWLNKPGVMSGEDQMYEDEAIVFLLSIEQAENWGNCSEPARRVVNSLLLDFMAKLHIQGPISESLWSVPKGLPEWQQATHAIRAEILRSHPHYARLQITLSPLYIQARALSECLYRFPYMHPEDAPDFVKNDKELMEIIETYYKTTVTPEGCAQQTTITAAERIRLQGKFKERIHKLLWYCLLQDPEHGPALLLFPRVAEYNTRAKDRNIIICLYERFLHNVDSIRKGSRAYALIKQDIKNICPGPNNWHLVERHLAQYHWELAKLYRDANQIRKAIYEYKKACVLVPQSFGQEEDKIRLFAY